MEHRHGACAVKPRMLSGSFRFSGVQLRRPHRPQDKSMFRSAIRLLRCTKWSNSANWLRDQVRTATKIASKGWRACRMTMLILSSRRHLTTLAFVTGNIPIDKIDNRIWDGVENGPGNPPCSQTEWFVLSQHWFCAVESDAATRNRDCGCTTSLSCKTQFTGSNRSPLKIGMGISIVWAFQTHQLQAVPERLP